jgi:hypothetical protein
MIHTNKCEDNVLETRVEGTTQPHLGENLFAANRVKPVAPWKPSDLDAKEEEQIKKREEQQTLNNKLEAQSTASDVA